MSKLSKAISTATAAHDGQLYSDGEPYIFHVMRVVLRCKTEDERIVAALHDVVEDCSDRGFDLDSIRGVGFEPHIVNAVDLLTHRVGVSYMEYILKVAGNDLARRVKIADIEENCSRLYLLDDQARMERLTKKYVNALKVLKQFDRSLNNAKGDSNA